MRVAFSSDGCNSNATLMQPYKTVSLLSTVAIPGHHLMKVKWWFFFYHTATVTDTDIYHIKDLEDYGDIVLKKHLLAPRKRKTTSCTPKWVCSHKCRHRTRFIAGNADLQLFHKARADRYQQHTGQSMTKRQVRTNLSLCMYQQINNFASQRHEIVQISRLLGCIQQHRLFVHWMVVNIFPNDII